MVYRIAYLLHPKTPIQTDFTGPRMQLRCKSVVETPISGGKGLSTVSNNRSAHSHTAAHGSPATTLTSASVLERTLHGGSMHFQASAGK